MKVLVVDDSSGIWERLLGLLGDSSPGELSFSTTLGQARETLARQRPDKVVLDIQLPDGNGLDLLRELRGHRPLLPVAVFSNHPEFRRRALDLGATRFFDKSLDFIEMLAWLQGGGDETRAARHGE